MPDISQLIGSDLTVSANGDLLTADSVELSRQMVLRRLLTNPGDYIWHPDYGAGLRKMVGLPIDIPTVTSIIITQMYLEASVVRAPAPTVSVSEIPNGMYVDIQYVESDTQQSVTLNFNVTG